MSILPLIFRFRAFMNSHTICLSRYQVLPFPFWKVAAIWCIYSGDENLPLNFIWVKWEIKENCNNLACDLLISNEKVEMGITKL